MMSAPSPYPVITDTTSPLPDDAQINSVLPSICVDYLSHNWAKDEQIWSSWRAMTKSKNEITNGVRLENASWRTWAKQRGNLKTISPETLNWLKDSDVTWLYGPLHEKANPVPPPKQATFADRLGLESSSATPTRPHPSSGIQSDPFIHHSSEKRRSVASVAAVGAAPAPKSILKHRTIQDMLTLNMGRRAASPAIQPDSTVGCLLTPPTPTSAVPNDSNPFSGSSSSTFESTDRTISSFVRSDTCLPTSGFNSPPIRALAPGTPTEGATDYLAAVRLTRTASDDGSSSSSKADASLKRPSLLQSGRSSGSSRSAMVSAEERGKRPNRHISFNHRVEQCIALDEVSSDPLTSSSSSTTDRSRSQTPTAFNPSAAMMMPGSYSTSPASSSSMRSHLLQQYYGDEDEEDHFPTVGEDARQVGVSFLAQPNHRTVTTRALAGDDDDDDEADRLRFKTADLDDDIDTQQRMYTGSASSEEDLSVSSSSDGYDSDALTMRSSSVGSVSDSSTSHLSSARDSVLGFRSGTVHAGLQPESDSSHDYRSHSRKGSLSSHHAAMHTIAKLAPTLLKTSEAYPAPSPAVVDPSNFLQTLEHDREREQIRVQQCIYSGFGRDSDRYSYHRPGDSASQGNSAWAMGDNLFDPAFFPTAHAELYGSSLPVSIPTFGRDGRYGQDLRYDNYGQYSSSASAAAAHRSSFDSHRYGPANDDSCLFANGPSSVPTYHQAPHLDRASHPHLGSNAFEEYADADYDGEDFAEDDDIDIDLNLDVDDVDLDLDLDDEDEEEYEGQHDSAAYRSYYNRHSSRARGGGYAGPEGRLRSAHKYANDGGIGQGATMMSGDEEDGYERMQTSVESLRPEQAPGPAGSSVGARRG